MSEKYIDLKDEIRKDSAINAHVGIVTALRWLDEHPDQVPGRTITESEVRERLARESLSFAVIFNKALRWAGVTISPDPEPTNAEKLEARLLDLLGVVEAMGNTGVHNMAYELDRAGVKAPGGGE